MTTRASTDRREFLKGTAALAAWAALPSGCATHAPLPAAMAGRSKKPAVIRGAFFYPRAEEVLAGKAEDSWSAHQWFTWPGNQFRPEEQQARHMDAFREIAAKLDLALSMDAEPLRTNDKISAFIESVKASRPDALLLVNFWNSFSAKLRPILDAFDGPIILVHPTGANHQLPPEFFRTATRTQYIHSIENWEAVERGFRSVHAHTRMAQSRLLRVSGKLKAEADDTEPFFRMPIHGIPTDQFNDLFDQTPADPEMKRLARAVRRAAGRVTDLEEKAFLDAVRAHATVGELLKRHDADAITIECLFLKHRKPCLSFGLNNGRLVPCGCENHLDATLTLMLGAACFGRGGFQHNPEYDTENNLYFASHCTCTPHLRGPDEAPVRYDLRPFFHQLPKSLALDVQWPSGERGTLVKYHSGKNLLDAWGGELLGSPGSPPTGGCATRALMRFDGVKDVCSVYPGPHPVLYCGDYVRQLAAYARLYGLELRTQG